MCKSTAQHILHRRAGAGLLHALATVSPEHELPIPITRGMGRTESRSVRWVEAKKSPLP